jgi:hypothetical protein
MQRGSRTVISFVKGIPDAGPTRCRTDAHDIGAGSTVERS